MSGRIVEVEAPVTVADRAPTGDRPNTLNQHAIERFNLPRGWRWFKWERIGPDLRPPHIGNAARIHGAVCDAVYTRGAYKGRANWDRRDRATELRAVITDAEHDAWLRAWERDEGKCRVCAGTGQEWTGWSRDTGDSHRTCRRCKGSGLPADGSEAVQLGDSGMNQTPANLAEGAV